MPQRIQRRRTKGWRMPANAVSVTRPGPFGNPFTGDGAAERFRRWLGSDDPEAVRVRERLPALRGKDLACFCAPGKPCHADVLLEWANR